MQTKWIHRLLRNCIISLQILTENEKKKKKEPPASISDSAPNPNTQEGNKD